MQTNSAPRLPTAALLGTTLTILAIGIGAPATLAAAPDLRDPSWCGTSRFGLEISHAIHRQHQRQLERARASRTEPVGSRTVAPEVTPAGNIAVIVDDGGLAVPPAAFDLQGHGLRFTPGRRGLRVASTDASLDPRLGSKVVLADDDSATVNLPSGFAFPFFGRVYTTIYVNSDGNLTFGAPERQGDRELDIFLSGPPRIAPFLTDLDPSQALGDAGVYVAVDAGKLVVTWQAVPNYGQRDSNTFQVTLLPDGEIVFAYGAVAGTGAVVGLSPGLGSRLELLDYDVELPAQVVGRAVAERFGTTGHVDEFGIARAFFSRFADAYDHLLVFLDFPMDFGGGFAYELGAKNEVSGIGSDLYDYASLFGSHGRLHSFVMMSSLAHFPADPDQIFLHTNSTMDVLGQEAGHRWLAYLRFRDSSGNPSNALLGRDLAHWSFVHNTLASDMEGNEILDQGGGNFLTTAATERYSPLDQYAMGLIPSSEVPPFFFVANTGIPPYRHPETGVAFSGQRQDVHIEDVIAAEGERNPPSTAAPKAFAMAFVLIVEPGKTPSRESLSKLDAFRRRWETYFHEATGSRATVDTRLRLR
jgi:hypothetical protein